MTDKHNRPLTAAQLRVLRWIDSVERHAPRERLTEFSPEFSGGDLRVVRNLLHMKLIENKAIEHLETGLHVNGLSLTEAGRAALAPDTEPSATMQTEPLPFDGTPLPPAFDFSEAGLREAPVFTPPAEPTADAATRFDSLVTEFQLQDERLSYQDLCSISDYPFAAYVEALRKLSVFAVNHAAAIRAALASQPEPLRAGDSAVVIGSVDYDKWTQNHTGYPFPNTRVSIIEMSDDALIEWSNNRGDDYRYIIPTRFLRRVEGGSVQR